MKKFVVAIVVTEVEDTPEPGWKPETRIYTAEFTDGVEVNGVTHGRERLLSGLQDVGAWADLGLHQRR